MCWALSVTVEVAIIRSAYLCFPVIHSCTMLHTHTPTQPPCTYQYLYTYLHKGLVCQPPSTPVCYCARRFLHLNPHFPPESLSASFLLTSVSKPTMAVNLSHWSFLWPFSPSLSTYVAAEWETTWWNQDKSGPAKFTGLLDYYRTDGDMVGKGQRHSGRGKWRMEEIQTNGDKDSCPLGVIKLPSLAWIIHRDGSLQRK